MAITIDFQPTRVKKKRIIDFTPIDFTPIEKPTEILFKPTTPQVGISPTEQIELDKWAREQEAMPWPVRPEEERRLVKPEITPEALPPVRLAEPEPLDIGLEWTPPPEEVVLRAPIPTDITPPEIKPLEDAIN